MSIFVVRLPDVGEGVAEAELVAWHVAVGEPVTSDTVVAEVLTDKATVEIYAPVEGTVARLHGAAGDVLAVGSELLAIETVQLDSSADEPPPAPAPPALAPPASATPAPPSPEVAVPSAASGSKILGDALAAPAVRQRARTMGVDLCGVVGSGLDGRVTHHDLDRYLHDGPTEQQLPQSVQVPLIGMRRKIAERMTNSYSRIPHITYVDEIDMTQLEHLRDSLATAYPAQPRLTLLPFVMRAIVLAVVDRPHINATFDDEAGVLTTRSSVDIGIATQTAAGLVVPVVRNAHSLDLWQAAAELERVAIAARNGTAQRADLSGSSITITSLGALGGLVTTPIINHPEVAIVGINKMQVRPAWNGTSFEPRKMMNLSSSFDHRIVDGWDAATFIQHIKSSLEAPALLVMQPPADQADPLRPHP